MTETTAPTLTAAQKRVADLELKLKQARALAQKEANRQRSKEAGVQRKIDTRRKVLLGSFVQSMHTKNGIHASQFTYESERFADFLKRDDDRALFGLGPVVKEEAAPVGRA
jgi:hypothetical protein